MVLFIYQHPLTLPFDDFGMTFIPGSKKGYFSSDRLSSVDHIYTFVENDLMYTLNGVITRKVNGEPISNAMVTLMNLTDDAEEEYYSDDVGMFEIPLIPGKNSVFVLKNLVTSQSMKTFQPKVHKPVLRRT